MIELILVSAGMIVSALWLIFIVWAFIHEVFINPSSYGQEGQAQLNFKRTIRERGR